MSLAIEVDDVVAVLLRDGWHKVTNKSFEIDAYEFIHRDYPGVRDAQVRVGGGTVEGVSSTGARWQGPGGSWTACPFPEILAVRYRPPARRRSSAT